MITPQPETASLPPSHTRRRVKAALRMPMYGSNSKVLSTRSIRNHTIGLPTVQHQRQALRLPLCVTVSAKPDARKSVISTFLTQLSNNQRETGNKSLSLLHNPPHISTPAPHFSTENRDILHTMSTNLHTLSTENLPASRAHRSGEPCSTVRCSLYPVHLAEGP